MKKQYITPKLVIEYASGTGIICTSSFGPNSEGIPFEGEEGDEEIYHPSHARGIWDE